MKIPKFIYANDDRDDKNEEEAEIGIVLACADRIQEHKEAVWDHPKFDRFYYCEFTHDDGYPAWDEQTEYHWKVN